MSAFMGKCRYIKWEGQMRLYHRNRKQEIKNLKEKGVKDMKRMLMLSLVLGLVITVVSHAFAMVQEPPIIEKKLAPAYTDIKPSL